MGFKDELKADRKGKQYNPNESDKLSSIRENEIVKRIQKNINTNVGSSKNTFTKEESSYYPYSLAHTFFEGISIEDTVITTQDNRHLTILEINPVNFELRSDMEKINIINSFKNYLLLTPISFQIKCVTKPPAVREMIEHLKHDYETETVEKVKLLHENNANFIADSIMEEGISNRYFIILEHESKGSLDEKIKAELNDARYTAKQYLVDCGLDVINYSQVTRHETARLLYEIINGKTKVGEEFDYRVGEICDYYYDNNKVKDINKIPLSEFIAPETLEFEDKNFIRINDMYYTFIFIAGNGYPTEVPIAWTQILNLGNGIDVDMFFRKLDKGKVTDSLRKRNRISSLRTNDVRNNEDKVRQTSVLAESTKYMRDSLNVSSEEFYFASTMITVSAYTPEDLKFRKKEVLKYLNTKQISVFDVPYRNEEAYKSYLPFNYVDKDLFKQSRQNMLTDGVASFFPFTSYEMNSPTGCVIGFAQSNNSVVSLDNFDKDMYNNANMLLMGTAGAGKTYTLMLLAIRQRLKHIPVYMIMPAKGHEAARVCKGLGGSFIKLSTSSNDCINVMEIKPYDLGSSTKELDDGASDYSYLAQKLEALHICFSLIITDITLEENQLLDDALVQVYDDYGITMDNDSIFLDKEKGTLKKMPILEDVYKKLEKNKKTERIANILKVLVTGSAKNFNRRTNVDLDNEFTVIDISRLQGSLQPFGMFIALEFVKGKAMADRTKKKSIIIDEMWELMGASSNTLAAGSILELYKIIRGYGGAIIGATQDIKDFYALENGKYGEGIITNSSIKIILKLEHKEALRAKDDLNLNDSEARRIENFNTGNAMLIANNSNIAIAIKASPLEHDLIATDRDSLSELLKKQKGDESNE